MMKRAIPLGVTLLVGALAGSFLAGPIVMADGPFGERVMAAGVMAVIFLLLGALFGRWLRSWTAGLWLAAPGVLVALLLGDRLSYVALAVAALVASSLAGAWAGPLLFPIKKA